jgi:hypothetical protein
MRSVLTENPHVSNEVCLRVLLSFPGSLRKQHLQVQEQGCRDATTGAGSTALNRLFTRVMRLFTTQSAYAVTRPANGARRSLPGPGQQRAGFPLLPGARGVVGLACETST